MIVGTIVCVCTFGSYGGVYLFSTVVVVAVAVGAVPPDVRRVYSPSAVARGITKKRLFSFSFSLCVPPSLSLPGLCLPKELDTM